jgi:hypothetical protein
MMADRATSDRIAADMQPPKYREAVKRIRGINAKKQKIGGVNGEIKGIYDQIEGYRVDKRAARIFLTLDNMEHEDRVTIFRDLNKMIDVADWAPAQADIVDQAQGNVVTLRAGGAAQVERDREENAAGEDREIDETMTKVENDGGDDVTGADQAGSFLSDVAAQRAKERSETQSKRRKPKEEDVIPYTGDNSDLAGE